MTLKHSNLSIHPTRDIPLEKQKEILCVCSNNIVISESTLCTCVLSHFSRVRLCNPTDCSPPGSSVHGILQARILELVAMPSSGDLPNSGIKPVSLISPTLPGRFFTTSITWEAQFYVYCWIKQMSNYVGVIRKHSF